MRNQKVATDPIKRGRNGDTIPSPAVKATTQEMPNKFGQRLGQPDTTALRRLFEKQIRQQRKGM